MNDRIVCKRAFRNTELVVRNDRVPSVTRSILFVLHGLTVFQFQRHVPDLAGYCIASAATIKGLKNCSIQLDLSCTHLVQCSFLPVNGSVSRRTLFVLNAKSIPNSDEEHSNFELE